MSTIFANPPDCCDVCKGPFSGVFYDGRTKQGHWAVMCPTCFILGQGIGKTGQGLGQKYARSHVTGEYRKVEG